MEWNIQLTNKKPQMFKETIKSNGAFPPTICILKGKINIGLDSNTLLDISKNKNDFIKCSIRIIPYELMAKKREVRTTVETTMFKIF